jgi:hypothetical protein
MTLTTKGNLPANLDVNVDDLDVDEIQNIEDYVEEPDFYVHNTLPQYNNSTQH